VDESGVDDNIVVQYGWAEKGTRSYVEQAGFKRKRLSIVAGVGYEYGSKSIVAPFEYEEYTDTEMFNNHIFLFLKITNANNSHL
jgi:hypothetical protein